jgi:hypothetical protein
LGGHSRQDEIAAELDAAAPPLCRRAGLERWVLKKLNDEDFAHALAFRDDVKTFSAWQEHTRAKLIAEAFEREIRVARRGDYSALVKALEAPESVRRALVDILKVDRKRGAGRPRIALEKRRRAWVVRAAADVRRITRILRDRYGKDINRQLRSHYERLTVTKLAIELAAKRWTLEMNALENYRRRPRRDRDGRILRPDIA